MINDLIEKLFAEVPKARTVIYDVGGATPLQQIKFNGEEFDIFIKRDSIRSSREVGFCSMAD